jgi:long-subunit acyl-CoA synthetase (AMP-forming)
MIFRSQFPEPSIPDQHLPEFVLARAGDHAERAALVDAVTGRGITYGELRDQVQGFAAGLSSFGVR